MLGKRRDREERVRGRGTLYAHAYTVWAARGFDCAILAFQGGGAKNQKDL